MQQTNDSACKSDASLGTEENVHQLCSEAVWKSWWQMQTRLIQKWGPAAALHLAHKSQVCRCTFNSNRKPSSHGQCKVCTHWVNNFSSLKIRCPMKGAAHAMRTFIIGRQQATANRDWIELLIGAAFDSEFDAPFERIWHARCSWIIELRTHVKHLKPKSWLRCCSDSAQTVCEAMST